MLKSQTTFESADRLVEKADDTNGSMEDIGGEVCAWGAVTLTVSVEGEVCAMAGETKATKSPRLGRITADEKYHMIILTISYSCSYSTYILRDEKAHGWDTGNL